jgi:hypothetical protein
MGLKLNEIEAAEAVATATDLFEEVMGPVPAAAKAEFAQVAQEPLGPVKPPRLPKMSDLPEEAQQAAPAAPGLREVAFDSLSDCLLMIETANAERKPDNRAPILMRAVQIALVECVMLRARASRGVPGAAEAQYASERLRLIANDLIIGAKVEVKARNKVPFNPAEIGRAFHKFHEGRKAELAKAYTAQVKRAKAEEAPASVEAELEPAGDDA